MVREEIEGVAPIVTGGWAAGLEGLHGRVAHRFVRPKSGSGRGATSSACSGGSSVRTAGGSPRRSGRPTRRASSDYSTRRGGTRTQCATTCRGYVVEHLGDEETGVLIVDETGFLKKGEKSVGVACQYTGTVGDTVNCQVGVFLAYASDRGAAFVDRALYLPKGWAGDEDRRAEAGVPKEVSFASKIELAKRMLERAFGAGVPARWVLADSFYGRSGAFRAWLEKRGRPYAVMVRRLTRSVSGDAGRGSIGSSSACPRGPSRRSTRRRKPAGGGCGSGRAWNFSRIRLRGCAGGCW